MRVVCRAGWLSGLLLAVVALGSTARADEGSGKSMNSLLGLPQCAMTCFLELRQQDLPCDFDDIDCLCTTPSFEDEATKCVLSNCTIKESMIARNLTSTACGVPIRDNSQTYVNLAIVFSVISGLAVIQRFIAKILAENLTLGLDDYMVLLATIVQAPMAGIGVEGGVACGLGRDIWTLTFDQVTRFGFFLYVFTVLYFLDITIIKLSFLFFYLRVFPRKKVRRYLWATVAFTIVFGVTFVITGIFQCQPISHYWERWTEEEEGKCVNVSAVAWANGAISIALDLWIMAIPLSQVRNLNLDWKKKVEVTFMFGVGFFITIMSCLRLQSLIAHNVHSTNATWVKQELANWSTVEVNVGIICACLPSMRTLFVMAFGRIPLPGSQRRSRQSELEDAYNQKSRAFGTVSRSMAEPVEGGVPVRHGGIRLERTCEVQFETVSQTSSDEARLVKLGDLEMFDSSSSNSVDKTRPGSKDWPRN